MSGFPKLIPAFTAQLVIEPPSSVGPLAVGTSLTHIALTPGVGSLKSEPDYPIKVDAIVQHGADFIKADPDGRHVRLEVQSLLKDKATRGLIRFNYTGVLNTEGACGKVLQGAPDAATTGFGDVFTQVQFETGTPELAALQTKVYVGSGQFIIEARQPTVVEYKISEVVG